MVDADSKPATLREEFTAVYAKIGKLRVEKKTGRYQLEYNCRQASDQYSSAVYERLKSESRHRRKVLAREKRVEDLKSKVFATIDAETQTRGRNNELVVRVAGEVARRSRITDERARLILSMDALDMFVVVIIKPLGYMMDQLRSGITNLVWDGFHSACEELMHPAVRTSRPCLLILFPPLV